MDEAGRALFLAGAMPAATSIDEIMQLSQYPLSESAHPDEVSRDRAQRMVTKVGCMLAGPRVLLV